jgi:hypothetical protein
MQSASPALRAGEEVGVRRVEHSADCLRDDVILRSKVRAKATVGQASRGHDL